MRDGVPKKEQNGIGVYVQNESIMKRNNRRIDRLFSKVTSGKKKYGFKKVKETTLTTNEKIKLINKIKQN